MTQMEAVMESTEALPATVLYSLLKALGPKAILKGGPRPRKGVKVDPSARQAFDKAVKAADKARSAAEFARLIDAGGIQEDAADVKRNGPIVGLEVYYSNGDTLIRMVFANGVTFDHYYPAGTL